MIYRKLIKSDTRFFACIKLNYFTKLCCFVARTRCTRIENNTAIENNDKGQKTRENNDNNRLVRRCSIVMWPVLTSSTPRSLHK